MDAIINESLYEYHSKNTKWNDGPKGCASFGHHIVLSGNKVTAAGNTLTLLDDSISLISYHTVLCHPIPMRYSVTDHANLINMFYIYIYLYLYIFMHVYVNLRCHLNGWEICSQLRKYFRLKHIICYIKGLSNNNLLNRVTTHPTMNKGIL